MQIRYNLDSIRVLEAFCRREYDTKESFDLRIQAHSLMLSRGFDRLISLDTCAVQLFPHQRQAVLRVLQEMRGRAVLADEVGLGKTIEAGVVLKEYMLRGLCRRALILVPAALVGQWRAELADKLGLRFAVATRPKAFQAAWVLASLDTAKRAENAAVIHSRPWDMVIVDEAHRLKNKRTLNWRFVNGIEKKYLLLLTATPVQNDLRELFNLITLLRPGQLKTYSEFKQEFVADRQSPKNLRRLQQLLGEVMVRRSRREAMIHLPRRHVQALSVPLSSAEMQFYRCMLEVLGAAYRSQPKKERNLLPFLLLLRETCSHPAAASRTLRGMKQAGRERVLPESAIARLLELCPQGAAAKERLLLDFLATTEEPVIVFTEFRATQAAVSEACAAMGRRPILYHGGMTAAEKDAAIADFRRHGGVLISTESGGEGRNLQFCRTMVNYDLPWNPMRLEQRIGRVHRLGQVEEVLVINLVTEGTVDSYVLYLLEKKIRMFQRVVGELEAILASLEGPYEQILLRLVLDSRDQEELRTRIEAFGRQLEQACFTYERVVRLNAQLFEADIPACDMEA